MPGALVLDLGVEPLLPGKGLEILTVRQFALLAGGQPLPPDPALTSSLAYGAGETLVVPPGTPVRFELAFATDETAAALVVHGFQGKAELPLSGLPVSDFVANGLVNTPMAGRLGLRAGSGGSSSVPCGAQDG